MIVWILFSHISSRCVIVSADLYVQEYQYARCSTRTPNMPSLTMMNLRFWPWCVLHRLSRKNNHEAEKGGGFLLSGSPDGPLPTHRRSQRKTAARLFLPCHLFQFLDMLHFRSCVAGFVSDFSFRHPDATSIAMRSHHERTRNRRDIKRFRIPSRCPRGANSDPRSEAD